MIGRAILFMMGAGGIAASAHISIMSSGGYESLLSIRIAALAALLMAGAYGVRYAWDHGMRAVAFLTFFVLLAGEAFVILMSANQQAAAIEATHAPQRAVETRRQEALRRAERAESSLAALPPTSARISAAVAAKIAADSAVIEKASDKGCRDNCRILLQQQVDAAGSELAAARTEIATARGRAERELFDAQSALKIFAAPAPRNPVAQYLALSEVEFALLASILASIALNAGGTLILTIALHGQSQQPVPSVRVQVDGPTADKPEPMPVQMMIAAPPVVAEPTDKLPLKRSVPMGRHVADFIHDRLKHSPGAMTQIRDIHHAYLDWCKSQGTAPRPMTDVMPKVTEGLMTLGIRGTIIEGVPYARDVAVRQPALAAA